MWYLHKLWLFHIAVISCVAIWKLAVLTTKSDFIYSCDLPHLLALSPETRWNLSKHSWSPSLFLQFTRLGLQLALQLHSRLEQHSLPSTHTLHDEDNPMSLKDLKHKTKLGTSSLGSLSMTSSDCTCWLSRIGCFDLSRLNQWVEKTNCCYLFGGFNPSENY